MPYFHDSRIRYLHEAAISGSVRTAADRLGIAPSAVSRQITLLEEELGSVLLERHRKGVIPTQAGELLIAYYRQQSASRQDVVAKLESLRGLNRGSIHIVSGEGFAPELMSGPIRQFRQNHPGIAIAIDIAGTTEILRRIREDEAEVGLVYYAPPDARIVVRRSALQPLQAIVANGHPLQLQKSVTLASLTQWPIALTQGAFGIRQLLDHAERSEKTRLEAALTTNLFSVLIHFVTSEQGIALLPAFAVANELKAGIVKAVPINSPSLSQAEAQLITRAGRHLSPAANRFVQYCMQGMQAFQTSTSVHTETENHQ